MTRLFAREGPWLFSRSLDLWAFGGSALAAWALVALGWPLGLLVDSEAPTWTFFACVVAVDVAHVWSMGFRCYFDGSELRARPLLYLGVPLAAYGLGVGLHAFGARVFWGALAYLAVFHFVRQQAGFLRLYARRNPAQTPLDSALEQAAIYAAMLAPLVSWHARSRSFSWLVEGDFVELELIRELAARLYPAAAGACALLFTAFALRQAWLARRGGWVPGKSVLMTATASCWWLGIVAFDSDYVFTVTNVIIHGVPYFVLTQRYARARGNGWAGRVALRGVVPVLLFCLVLALAEEALWDRWVWHERPQYFGEVFPLSPALLTFLVPLLAVPQASHYVLDGFLWRVRSENVVLRRELESG